MSPQCHLSVATVKDLENNFVRIRHPANITICTNITEDLFVMYFDDMIFYSLSFITCNDSRCCSNLLDNKCFLRYMTPISISNTTISINITMI